MGKVEDRVRRRGFTPDHPRYEKELAYERRRAHRLKHPPKIVGRFTFDGDMLAPLYDFWEHPPEAVEPDWGFLCDWEIAVKCKDGEYSLIARKRR